MSISDEGNELIDSAEALKQEVSSVAESVAISGLGDDFDMEAALFYMWMLWADFEIRITWPIIDFVHPPILHKARTHEDGRVENVFTIHDKGPILATSRAEEVPRACHDLNRYYNTIDKMITIMLDKLKAGGVSPEEEVRIAFSGFELGCRKAFEVVLNLEENVLVVNYDPGEWGERYMKNVLEMVERGYGMPKSRPLRDF